MPTNPEIIQPMTNLTWRCGKCGRDCSAAFLDCARCGTPRDPEAFNRALKAPDTQVPDAD
jgi:hypothetical protein